MEHDDVDAQRRTSAAWRLLRADTAPLVLSFLGTVFVEENVRSISETELVARLDDHLYLLNHTAPPAQPPGPLATAPHGAPSTAVPAVPVTPGAPTPMGPPAAVGPEPRYPRTPRAYVDHWAHPDQGWLRAWYPPGENEPHYDATPAVEHAVRWVTTLRSRAFVGTESRLNTVFELLRQLVVGTETDPEERVRELEERRARIDEEIAEVRAGRLQVLDAAAQRDRYQQLTHTAADLLSDFREVEANFRDLDRRLRERITGWDGAKGELLDEVVAARDAIATSDQGRSFHAFYDFLLDRRRQEEFAELVGKVQGLDAIAASAPASGPGLASASGSAEPPDAAPGATPEGAPDALGHHRLRRIHYDWLDAGERTQATVRTLSEQLRRFLDDQVWLENRRVIDILRSVEARALAVRDADPPGMPLDALAPEIVLPTERPLFTSRAAARLDSEHVEVGDDDFEADALYDQVHVDPERLARTVRATLGRRSQVSLADLVGAHPLEHGLAELVTYLSLEDPRFVVVHDPEAVDEVTWTSDAVAGVPAPSGAPDESTTPTTRVARLDRITYARRGARAVAAPADPPPAPADPPPAAPTPDTAPTEDSS